MRRPPAPASSPVASSGGREAAQRLSRSASLPDCEELLQRCLSSDAVWLSDFSLNNGCFALSSLLRSSSPKLSPLIAAALSLYPPLFLDDPSLFRALLSFLRPDAVLVDCRQFALEALAFAVRSESRDKALAWLRHVQGLCREPSLLGRFADLLTDDVGSALGACAVLLAWCAHGDASQQAATRRELLLLGVAETCRRRMREEMLAPQFTLLLRRVRGPAAAPPPRDEPFVILLNNMERTVETTERVGDLVTKPGTRIVFAGCVPQSVVPCAVPELELYSLQPVRCEVVPVPWRVRIEGPVACEERCRLDPRLTGAKVANVVVWFPLSLLTSSLA